MKRISTRLLLATIGVVALSIVATASASATEFTFSKTGTLAGKQVNSQTFVSPQGTWECQTDKLSGSATKLKTATQKVTVQYEKCSFFGIKLTASAAEYELNTNGTLKILKAFKMTGEGCTFNFPAQSLTGVTYKNTTGKVEVKLTVNSVKSSGEGSFCEHAENSETLLSGKSLLELTGGTVEVI